MSILNWLNASQWKCLGPSPINAPGIGIGTAAGRVEAAAPDPTSVDVMYVNGSDGGVWKTGVWTFSPPTWLVLGDAMPSLASGGYHSILVHPKDHTLILAVASGVGAGVMKSHPSTLSFQLMGNSTFEGLSLGSVAVHPTNTDIMYVSVWNAGVYKSTDGGLNWQKMTAFHAGGASDVIVPSTDPNTVYAGLVPMGTTGVSSSGVYKSTDGGAHWTLMTGLESGAALTPKDAFGNITYGIRLAATSVSGTVYVALFTADVLNKAFAKRYKTVNGGVKWTPLTATPGSAETRSWHMVLAVDPKDATHIFANDAYSLFKSTNSGKTWSSAEPAKAIGDDWVNMTFDRSNNGVVTSDQGIYRVGLKNNTWVCCDGNLAVTQFYDITLDPKNPDVIYGIGQDQRQVMKFSGSILWDYLPVGSETGKVLVDPGNTKILYVFTPQVPTAWVSRSKDGGQTWKTILTTMAFAKDNYDLAYSSQKSFAMDPSDSTRLLLGSNEVWETKNAKDATPTWKSLGKPSPGQFISALAIAPSNGKRVYVATKDGHVWTTANGAAPWSQLDNGLFGSAYGFVCDFRVDPSNAKHVFAVTYYAGGARIWHLGPAFNYSKWVDISGDLPANLGASTIYVDWQYAIPALWVGTSRGVYASVNQGQNWTKFAHDMPNDNVTDLQGTSSNGVLAAATSGRGVFGIRIGPSKISGTVTEGSGLPLVGAKVFLDVGGDGLPSAHEYQTTTDAKGNYVLAVVAPGTYTPRVVPPAGYVQTAATTKSLSVNRSSVSQALVVKPKASGAAVSAPAAPALQSSEEPRRAGDFHHPPGRG